jgi:hypothetical protein
MEASVRRLFGLVALRHFVLLVFLVPLFPEGALGKGGTNMHEMLSTSRASVVPTFDPSSLIQSLGGCGRGRYRDTHTHKCRGPADFGN